MKPTDEQIKEFWEWCGWKWLGEFKGWQHPDGNKRISLSNIKLDLNNLFKYAVPKVNFCDLTKHDCRDLVGWFAAVRIKEKTGFINHDDPALALFWAIYEVRNETSG